MSGDTVIGWSLCLTLVWMAILSKQEAIVAFGFVLLFEVVLAKTRATDWRLWGRAALMAVPTAGYFVLRALWITKQNPGDDLRYASGLDFPLTMMKAHVFYYGRNIVWPFEMRALATFDLATSLADIKVLDRAGRDRGDLAGGVALPEPNAAPYLRDPVVLAVLRPDRVGVPVPLHRHRLPPVRAAGIPFRGRGAGVGVVAEPFGTRLPCSGVFVVFSAVASISINTHWKTEESFWHQSVKYGARSIAHTNYAFAVADRDPALAEFHYLEALRQEPDNIYPNINLGMLYVHQQRFDEGLPLLRSIAERNPTSALAAYWLSKGLGSAGLPDEQLSAALRAAELDPDVRYQYEAGLVLQLAGDTSASIPYLERVVAKSAGYEEALFLLAFAHGSRGMPTSRSPSTGPTSTSTLPTCSRTSTSDTSWRTVMTALPPSSSSTRSSSCDPSTRRPISSWPAATGCSATKQPLCEQDALYEAGG